MESNQRKGCFKVIRILLCGANGKMGHVIASCVAERDNMKIVAGIDLNTEKYSDFPIFLISPLAIKKQMSLSIFQIRLYSKACLLMQHRQARLWLLQQRGIRRSRPRRLKLRQNRQRSFYL